MPMPVDFVPMRDEITTTYDPPGTTQAVTLHDGSVIHLQKAADGGVKTDDRNAALMRMQEARDEGNILTGLMFLDPNQADLTQTLNLATTPPLNELGKDELCPGGSKVLKSINEGGLR